jgi:NIMA (never in mitosis gene a)-related kinase
MATMRPPFKASDMKGLYKKVIQAQYPPLPGRFSKEIKEIIAWMLRADPKERPTCTELLSSSIIVN